MVEHIWQALILWAWLSWVLLLFHYWYFHRGKKQSVHSGLCCSRLDCDHTSCYISRGLRSLKLIIKHLNVTARTNTRSNFLLSFLCLCVRFLSLYRKQGSAAPTPVSPSSKSEKRCIPSCLRHKRSKKRVGWPRNPGQPQQPCNPQQKPVCHPVTTLTVTREIIDPPMGEFTQIFTIWTVCRLSTNVQGWRSLDRCPKEEDGFILLQLTPCFRKWSLMISFKDK